MICAPISVWMMSFRVIERKSSDKDSTGELTQVSGKFINTVAMNK